MGKRTIQNIVLRAIGKRKRARKEELLNTTQKNRKVFKNCFCVLKKIKPQFFFQKLKLSWENQQFLGISLCSKLEKVEAKKRKRLFTAAYGVYPLPYFHPYPQRKKRRLNVGEAKAKQTNLHRGKQGG